jgi:hypothetical protein
MGYRIYITDNIDVVELDAEEVDIQSIFSLLDVTDISLRKDNIKSIVFNGTPTNNQAFGNMFDLSRETTLGLQNNLFFNYNPLRSVVCAVYEESELVFKGSLRISGIQVDEFGNVKYQTVITSSFIDLKTQIQDKYLTDLDFSDLKHRYNIQNITGSWSGSTERYNTSTSGFTSVPFAWGSGYVYPMVDYGYTYVSASTATVNEWNLRNFKPAVYFKEYLNRIFAQPSLSGFTYEIRGSQQFKDSIDRLIVPDVQENNTSVLSGLSFTYSKSILTDFTAIRSEASSKYYMIPVNYGVTGGTYPAYMGSGFADLSISSANVLMVKRDFETTMAGDVQLEIKINRVSPFSMPYAKYGYALKLVKFKDAAAYTTYLAASDSNKDSLYTTLTEFRETFTPSLNPRTLYTTQKLRISKTKFLKNELVGLMIQFDNHPYTFSVKVLSDSITFPYSINDNIYYSLHPSSSTTVTDCIVPIAPVNIKQFDFLKGFINQFNLVAYSSNNNFKHIVFEKYDDFNAFSQAGYIKTNSIDWSDKLDLMKGFTIKPNIDLPKSYVFSHKKDDDYLNDAYYKKYNQSYGQLAFDDSYGLRDTKKVELIFSPTPMLSETNSDRSYPALYKVENGNKKVSKQNIRLLFYNGLIPCQKYQLKNEEAFASTYAFNTYLEADVYPQASNYLVSGITFTSTGVVPTGYTISGTVITDLHFNRPLEYYFNASESHNSSDNSYSCYINQVTELTNPNVVFLEAQFNLNEVDISNLDLRVPIYLSVDDMNGAYFKIISLEYSGHESPSTAMLQRIAF